MAANRILTGAVASGLALCLGAGLGLGVSSQASAQTLREALALAYDTNPSLKGARAQLRATDEIGNQARAQGRPRLGAQLSYETAAGNYDPGDAAAGLLGPGDPDDPDQGGGLDLPPDVLEGLTGNGGTGTRQIGVELEQPLFQGFRVKNGVARAEAQIDAAQAELLSAEQQLLFDTVAAYLAVVTAQEAVSVTETSLELLNRQREQATTLFETGQATRTDTAQAEARVAQAEAELIRVRSRLSTARARFERLTGRMPGTLETNPPLPPLPATLDEALATAQDGNPQLIAARKQEQASRYALKVARGALAPTITARASYGYAQNQFIDGDQSENATLGAQITIPLYQGGATYSGIRQAREAHSADRYRLYDAERLVREQVDTAWRQLDAARAAYEATRPAVEASELAFEGLTLEGRLGQRSTLDVLDGEAELLRVRLSRLEAREGYYLAAFGLMQAMGMLTAEALGLDVVYYDPEENRQAVAGQWFGAGANSEE